ncbi:SRPBCC family protein [soil metagenome]
MSTTKRTMSCTPEDVFAVLSDGWAYATWVVGAARIRDVDAGWPKAGTKVHHSVGVWPLLLNDDTEVEVVEAPQLLQMRVRAWPTGEGRVTLHLRAVGPGCEVVMEEQAVSGPAKKLPKPLQDLMLHPRNVEALRRLAFLAENRARTP